MPNPDRGPVDVGTAPFIPHVAKGEGRSSAVSLLRRLPDGTHVPVWTHECSPKEAKSLCGWMWAMPEDWSIWGRIALRIGSATLDPMIIDRARKHAAEEKERERRLRKEERERERLAREITLYLYDPKHKRSSLGLQRGSEDKAFWRMTFTEKWERDRVVDWLRWQQPRFHELEEYLNEHGSLELERLVLAGMRNAERAAKAKGITSAGRRPLRFWRGEQ